MEGVLRSNPMNTIGKLKDFCVLKVVFLSVDLLLILSNYSFEIKIIGFPIE